MENAPVGVFQAAVDPNSLDESTDAPDRLYVNETLADILSFDSAEHLHSEIGAVEYADPGDEERFHDLLEETGHVEAFETALVTDDRSGTPTDGE